MYHVFVFFISLCYLTSWTLAGSSIEFNITQERSKGDNTSIQTLECNREKILNLEVEESTVPVVIRYDGTQIEHASCLKENPTNTRTDKIFTLSKANYTSQSQHTGNTFKDTMIVTKENEGLWKCSLLINYDFRYPTMYSTMYNGRNCTQINCQFKLTVIDKPETLLTSDFFSKYKYWIIGGGSVAILIIIIMISQTIVILQFRARVNATKHIRPLSLIGRRHDRNNYSRTPGSQRRTTSKDENHYEIVQAFELAPTAAPIQDMSQRPPLPLPGHYDYEEPFNNLSDGTLRSDTSTQSPPSLNALPRRRRPQPEFEEECRTPTQPVFEMKPPKTDPMHRIGRCRPQPEFEEECPTPTPPVFEMKPPKTDPMISELGNRLRKRKDEEQSPLMPKKSFKSPQRNIPPPVPSKSQATAIRAHNMTDFETPHFLPPHQMPPKASPHLRSNEFLQPHAPSHITPVTPPIPRQYIPEHIRMQPDNFRMQPEEFHRPPEKFNMQRENCRMQPDNFRMQPERFRVHQEQFDMQPNNSFPHSKGNMSLPKRRLAPQNMTGMHNMRFADHMKSSPDITAALSAQMQQHHMKFRDPQAVKVPPPVLKKVGRELQASPAVCKPRFPSPRSTTFEEIYAGSDEEWNYEDLPPVNKYLNDY